MVEPGVVDGLVAELERLGFIAGRVTEEDLAAAAELSVWIDQRYVRTIKDRQARAILSGESVK